MLQGPWEDKWLPVCRAWNAWECRSVGFAVGGYASAPDTPQVDRKVAAPVALNPGVDARLPPVFIPTQELGCADAFNYALVVAVKRVPTGLGAE